MKRGETSESPDSHSRPDGTRDSAIPATSSDAIAEAIAFGVDIDLLRQCLARTPDERLRELDANMRFLADLQRSDSAKRGRKRT
jgi:hypothetical protein